MVTNVSQVRAPSTWSRTQAGSLPFWRCDATSVSITTSAIGRCQLGEELRAARQSTRNSSSSSSESQTSARRSSMALTGVAC